MTLRWIQVDNDARTQPSTGSYSDWKQEIATDCGKRCVYCGIRQCRYYGLDPYHVEHFKPKSKFPDLKNEIKNLFLACAVCNRFKGSDWIEEGHVAFEIGEYASPADNDFNELFSVDQSFSVSSVEPIGTYMIVKLFLNRPQLISDRRLDELQQRMKSVCFYLSGVTDNLMELNGDESKSLLAEIVKALSRLHQLRDSLDESSPYELSDIRRKK